MKKYISVLMACLIFNVCHGESGDDSGKSKTPVSTSVGNSTKITPVFSEVGNLPIEASHKNIDYQETNSNFIFSFWGILIFTLVTVLSILLIVVIIYIARINNKINDIEKELGETRKVSNSKGFNLFQSPLPDGLIEFERKIMNSSLIQSLITDVNKLKSLGTSRSPNNNPNNTPFTSVNSPIDTNLSVPSSHIHTSSSNSLTEGKNVSTNEIFYMVGPVNNYFPNNAKSPTKENTVYKFTVQPNRNEAIYEIHTSGAPVKEILSLAESYIKPACDEENIPSGTVKNIITRKHGTASLEGDKWIIKTKALIKYE